MKNKVILMHRPNPHSDELKKRSQNVYNMHVDILEKY